MLTRFNRSFWGLIVTQFFGAFNDNVLKVLVAFMIVQLVDEPLRRASLVDFSGAVFVAPFLLFSMIAGRLSDRLAKSYVIRATKFWELIVVAAAVFSLWLENVPFMMVTLFLLSTQATFFSPSKYGILPELMGEDRLSEANAYLNIATFTAILAGTLAGSFFANHRIVAYGIMVCASLLGIWSAFWIEPVAPAKPAENIRWNPFSDLLKNWKLIAPNIQLRNSILAINYFWFMGAALQLNIFLYAKEMMGASEKQTGLLIVALAVGIGVGSYIVGRLSRSHVQLGWVPIGAFGLSIFAAVLRFTYPSFAISAATLFLIGAFAGLYDIPLASLIQWESPAAERGRILATANFLSFVAILNASAVLFLMSHLFHLNSAQIFFWLGTGSFVVFLTLWLKVPFLRKLPGELFAR